jgi:hypothetical protein
MSGQYARAGEGNWIAPQAAFGRTGLRGDFSFSLEEKKTNRFAGDEIAKWMKLYRRGDFGQDALTESDSLNTEEFA